MNQETSFIPKIDNIKPISSKTKIDTNEVKRIESWFRNMLDGYFEGLLDTEKTYSREFINSVIELAKSQHGHDVPEAIYNLVGKSNRKKSLYCTYDISSIVSLPLYYDFASEADALEYKKQLIQHSNEMLDYGIWNDTNYNNSLTEVNKYLEDLTHDDR